MDSWVEKIIARAEYSDNMRFGYIFLLEYPFRSLSYDFLGGAARFVAGAEASCRKIIDHVSSKRPPNIL